MAGVGEDPGQIRMVLPFYYTCNECKSILDDPVQDCSGNRLCRSCSFGILQKRPPVFCLECKEVITDKCFHTDKAAANMWLQCPNESCNWENQLKNFKDHSKNCRFKPVQCGACNAYFRQEIVAAHRSTCIKLVDYDGAVFTNEISGIQETRRFPTARYLELFRHRLVSDIISATRVIDNFYQDSSSSNTAPERLIQYFRCDGFFYWKIPHFSDLKANAVLGLPTSIYSSSFYVSEARRYMMQLRLDINGYGEGYNSHMSLFLVPVKNANDSQLAWPLNVEVSFTLLNMSESENHTRTARLQPFVRPTATSFVFDGMKQFIGQTMMANCMREQDTKSLMREFESTEHQRDSMVD